MGRIKTLVEKEKFKEFKDKLVALGFKKDFGAQDEPGYVNIFYNNGECLWVTIQFESRTVYLYNEYECGGLLWKRCEHIPEDRMMNFDKFVDWLDSIVG